MLHQRLLGAREGRAAPSSVPAWRGPGLRVAAPGGAAGWAVGKVCEGPGPDAAALALGMLAGSHLCWPARLRVTTDPQPIGNLWKLSVFSEKTFCICQDLLPEVPWILTSP